MRRFATILFLLAALPATAGLTDLDNPGPAVTSVAIRQRYPWNGLVDVDVSFEGKSGETYRIELSATDKAGGTNLPVRTAWLEGAPGAVGNPVDVPAPGTHRFVWNAGADLPAGFVADRVTVTAKLLNPIWSFASIPEIDPNDVWAPATVYHDVQTVAAYGEIEDHAPTVRCLTDEWNLEASLGANVVFSGASMGLRNPSDVSEPGFCPINLWAYSASTNVYRIVTLDYNTGAVRWNTPFDFGAPDSDVRFFCMRSARYRQFAVLSRSQGPDAFLKSTGGSDAPFRTLGNRYADAEHGSAVCGYFPNGIPGSDASSTSVSSYDKELNSAVFFSGASGTDVKETVLKCSSSGSIDIQAPSKYSCMGNAVGRYVVPLLDGDTFFTVGYPASVPGAVQNFGLCVGRFTGFDSWDFSFCGNGYYPKVAWSKGVAMPDGTQIFLGGAGHATNGRCRMWQGSNSKDTFSDYPAGHPFESWARRDVTCMLPNGKFCGVDEELGLVVVNPLTGETYVASDNPAFKNGKMGCQLLPNGKVWIIPYDCEGREYLAGTNLCGKLYEVDFGFTRSFSLSSLCSPYLRVAEGDPEPSGIKVGLDPNGGELPGIYAMYYKGENPVYGELPVPTWTGQTFFGWSTDGTAANLVAATDPVPPLGILLKAAWQANVYTVKFNANGGSGTMLNQSFTYGVAQALTANAFTRTGYTFGGWATSATGAKVYDDGQSVSNLTATHGATVDFYAVWMPITYTVRFDANGGSGTMADQSFTYGVAQALTANAFTRTGCTFAGWAQSPTGLKVFDNEQAVSNLTETVGGVVNLYAVWFSKDWYVDMEYGNDANDGKSWATAKKTLQHTIDVAQDDDRIFVADGIYAPINANGRRLSIQSMNGASSTIIDGGGTAAYLADFGANATNSLIGGFTLRNGSGGVVGGILQNCIVHGVSSGSGVNWCLAENCLIYGNTATNGGGAIGSIVRNCTIVGNTAAHNGGGVYCSAVFNSIVYGNTADGAWNSASHNIFTRDQSEVDLLRDIGQVTVSSLTTNPGFVDAANGDYHLTATSPCIDMGDNTYVGFMETDLDGNPRIHNGVVDIGAFEYPGNATQYVVRFNANGGAGTMDSQSFTYGVAQALTANAFTRTGYIFGGWATNATGAKVYDDKQSVLNLVSTNGAIVDLYAVWTRPDAIYMVIDLSGGASTSSYPVTYMDTPPSGGFNTDEYKTTKLVLRCLEPGPIPTHDATITKRFYVGLFEMTQKQWALVMGNNPSWYVGDTWPVGHISYNDIRGSSLGSQWPVSNAVDADSFLGKLRARTGVDFDLPTEAQWEYACRAGTTTTFSYGDSVNGNYMWYYDNSSERPNEASTHEVGTKLPNGWSLYDMHGNVREMCLDWMDNGSLSGNDPVGSSSGSFRVERGGDASDPADWCTSSVRFGNSTSLAYYYHGFRLVWTLSD